MRSPLTQNKCPFGPFIIYLLSLLNGAMWHRCVVLGAKMCRTLLLVYNNDGVIKWKYFPCYWPFVQGIHRSPVNSLHKGQWLGALMFYFFICPWINDWVNNREAGHLRRHRGHYDVNVMECFFQDTSSVRSNTDPTNNHGMQPHAAGILCIWRRRWRGNERRHRICQPGVWWPSREDQQRLWKCWGRLGPRQRGQSGR